MSESVLRASGCWEGVRARRAWRRGKRRRKRENEVSMRSRGQGTDEGGRKKMVRGGERDGSLRGALSSNLFSEEEEGNKKGGKEEETQRKGRKEKKET